MSMSAENTSHEACGTVSGHGHNSRCCTLGELLHDCDWVSVMAVRKKCDEKGVGVFVPLCGHFHTHHSQSARRMGTPFVIYACEIKDLGHSARQRTSDWKKQSMISFPSSYACTTSFHVAFPPIAPECAKECRHRMRFL